LNSIEVKNVKDQVYSIVGSALENLSLKDCESAFIESLPYQRLRDEKQRLADEMLKLQKENEALKNEIHELRPKNQPLMNEIFMLKTKNQELSAQKQKDE